MENRNIYLCHFSNYFNRIKKPVYDLKEYIKYQVGEVMEDINFNENDGVQTEFILENDWDDPIPDYLVVTEIENYEIISRWFVLDAVRTRGGQYRLKLLRDVISDYYSQTMQSCSYIEKGFVTKDNPLIFNREGLVFNQVKKAEHLLYDKTNTSWIICYFDSAYPKEQTQISIDIQKYPDKNLEDFPLIEELKDSSGNLILDKSIAIKTPIEWQNSSVFFHFGAYDRKEYPLGTDIHAKEPNAGLTGNYASIYHNIQYNNITASTTKTIPSSMLIQRNDKTIWREETYMHATAVMNYGDYGVTGVFEIDDMVKGYRASGIQFKQYENLIGSFFPTPNREDIYESVEMVGTFKSTDGKIYEITVTPRNTEYRNIYVSDREKPEGFEKEYLREPLLYKTLKDEIKKSRPFYQNTVYKNSGDTAIGLQIAQGVYRFKVHEVKYAATTIGSTIATTINTLRDAPYKMIAIPYNATVKVGSETIVITPEIATDIAQMLIKSLQPQQGGGGFMYDVQHLPYCPQGDWITIDTDNSLVLNAGMREGIDYTLVKNNTTNVGIMIHALRSKFTFNIPFNIDTNQYEAVDFKVNRETTKYRLVSPNFANFQDFDPFMNNGVQAINVDCTYKPLTPYIKLNIDYGGLYGQDFNDDRGLICGGDFSIPMISNTWESYQIQNKNYANIFERETQKLETDFNISEEKRGARTAMAAGAGLVGAGVAASQGNFLGTIGGAASAVLAPVTAGIDYHYAKEQFDVNMDYRKDMYDFNLQNIQAKPQGLVRTSSFNFNNKLVPFVEKYEATEVEKRLFKNKLIKNGMTINAIDTPESFINREKRTFIKGRIIEINDIQDDSHIAKAIDEELNLGFFVEEKGENNVEK